MVYRNFFKATVIAFCQKLPKPIYTDAVIGADIWVFYPCTERGVFLTAEGTPSG